MQDYLELKEQLVSSAQELTRKGFLMATGGNISLHPADSDTFVITPSNFDYMKMKPKDVCLLDMSAEPIGRRIKALGGSRYAL